MRFFCGAKIKGWSFPPSPITLSVVLSVVSAVKENQVQEVHGDKPKDAQEGDYNGSRNSASFHHRHNRCDKKHKCHKTCHYYCVKQNTQKKLVEYFSVKGNFQNSFSVLKAFFHFSFLQIVCCCVVYRQCYINIISSYCQLLF